MRTPRPPRAESQVADRIAALRVAEAYCIAAEGEHAARKHKEKRGLKGGDAVCPAKEPTPRAHEYARRVDVLAPKVRREEHVQLFVVKLRKIDRLDLETLGIVDVQHRPLMQLPIHCDVGVLVHAARPPQECLDLWQPVERSPRAGNDDAAVPQRGDIGAADFTLDRLGGLGQWHRDRAAARSEQEDRASKGRHRNW